MRLAATTWAGAPKEPSKSRVRAMMRSGVMTLPWESTSTNLPVLGSNGVLAGAMLWDSSSSAVIQSIWSVTLPSTTRRYGASMKPYSFTRA